MDHKAKDAHHGGTAVVELDGTLGKLGLLVEGVPAEVKGAVAEVTGEITGSAPLAESFMTKSSRKPTKATI